MNGFVYEDLEPRNPYPEAWPSRPCKGFESTQAFDKAHGSNRVSVPDELGPARDFDLWLYADGACHNEHGGCEAPPADEYERAKLKVLYRDILLKKATEQFDSQRSIVLARAHNAAQTGAYPPQKEKVFEHLQRLKAIVDGRREKLAEATKEFEATDRRKSEQSEVALQAENRAKAQSLIGELQTLKI